MKIAIKCLFINVLSTLSSPVEAQELEGKWIITGNKSFGAFPGIHLMAVDKDSLSHYDFDKYVTKTSYSVEGGKLKIDTLAYATLDFKNPNRLSISSGRLDKPVDYVKLVPTTTSLSREEIEQIKYNLDRGGKNFEVDFKNHPDSKIMHSYLEKIDDTYFLVIYRYGKKVTAVPIKEVTGNKLSLYGFPNEPNEIVGEAVK